MFSVNRDKGGGIRRQQGEGGKIKGPVKIWDEVTSYFTFEFVIYLRK